VAATASPSLVAAPPGPTTPVATADQTPILVGLALLVLVVGGGLLLMRRRQAR
jgi:LPXTG-motif cell wall-anchored protein